MDFGDGQLVEEALNGSVVAFERLVARYERLVFKIAFGCTGRHDSALDILQNVFLKVYQKLAAFRTEGDFKNWVARIAVNESINWNRTQRRFRAEELDEAASPISFPSQEGNVRDRETWEIVHKSMQTLNPKCRAVIALRYFDGMAVEEVAGALGCSVGTAKSLIFRSLKQMRDHIGVAREVAL